MKEDKTPHRKSWDLMIGISLIIFYSFKLYNQIKSDAEWGFSLLFAVIFLIFGVYLIFRHFQNSDKE